MQKSRENSMHRFVIELRKLILGIFLSKNLDARFFPKKSLSVYNAVTSCKKNQGVSIYWFCAKHKTSLGAYFGYLLGQKLQNKIISKNYLRQFYVYATAISCKNQKRSIHLLLIILENLLVILENEFWAHFGSRLAKTLRNKVILKNHLRRF